MAGIPFELLEKLATLNAAQHARETVAAERVFSQSKLEVERLLASRRHDLSKEQFRAWRKAVRSGVMPPAVDPPSNTFAACWQNAVKFAAAEAILGRSLNRELNAARLSLMESARRFLPSYLIFAAPRLRQLPLGAAGESLPARRKSLRARERHLLLYLQRVCGKNDTLSEFGPESWGATDRATASLKLDPRPGIAQREIFLERWTAHGAAAAINADPQTRVELAPRAPTERSDRAERIYVHRQRRDIPARSRDTRAYSSAVMGRFPRIR